ncbi:hypothetical protein C8R44DRAFT_735054 [Mycena epipterygia]|nr:hypothetical protein C8R44DRAFT_735054 [Mycena epipterygia]
MTAPALQRLAKCERAFYTTQARQLRADRESKSNLPRSTARSSPRRTRARATDVAQQPRFIINTLIHRQWAVIAALDETKGRLGTPRQRAELMACVSCALARAIKTVEHQVTHGIAVNSHLRCRIKSLLKAFFDASEEQIGELDEYLVENISQLGRLEDLLELIDHTNERRTPMDERYKILEKICPEKYIKTSASLESPAVFAKIWTDIDWAAMKIAMSKIEDEYACLRSPPETKEIRKVDLIMSESNLNIFQTQGLLWYAKGGAHRPRARPYRTQIELPPVAEPGPKAKTKAPKRAVPLFPVGKRAYNVFERLLSGGREKGQLKFSEFRYVLIGSRRPHGDKTTIGPVLLREHETGLNSSYGWTLDWFARKSKTGRSDLVEGE